MRQDTILKPFNTIVFFAWSSFFVFYKETCLSLFAELNKIAGSKTVEWRSCLHVLIESSQIWHRIAFWDPNQNQDAKFTTKKVQVCASSFFYLLNYLFLLWEIYVLLQFSYLPWRLFSFKFLQSCDFAFYDLSLDLRCLFFKFHSFIKNQEAVAIWQNKVLRQGH